MSKYVTATLIEPPSADRWVSALKEPGSFLFVDKEGEAAGPGDEDRMYFCCPCGCGGHGSTPLRRGGEKAREPEWGWDGNREVPTLTPSVWFEKGRPGEWHGFLTAGVWSSC